METIDIVLKAVLELKEQVAVLSYKMDNLENMLANSSFRVSQKREDITDPIPVESNEQETAEEKLVRLYNQKKKENKSVSEDPEPEAEDFDLGELDDDPFEKKKNMSSEDLSELIKSECMQAFPSDSSINEDYINQSLINGSKKEDVSSTTNATLEEVKKRIDGFANMKNLQYNINKHI
ncbi:MAG: hypothetical protein E7077_05625 [Bacteroidales bacterium]|jgi:hypothetical protein|nr:hypothetical protein [Bacteroidales bacterium]